ncbi:hypothetical protein BY996DRAFT_6532589 [Phakopsora pachyrhizi]|nr:hypothetical protein BY996DRAFT_6532589 [Phakopsora pachyrhizi]
MINKTALINQHIYETKNGLYLSEDRRAEIRHKSESKSGNLYLDLMEVLCLSEDDTVKDEGKRKRMTEAYETKLSLYESMVHDKE